MKVTFIIPIEPVAKGRPRMGRGGRVFTPTKTRNFERMVATMSAAFKPPSLFQGPLRLTLRFIFRPPQKWVRDHHTTKPDCSNLAKGVEDALNGVFWVDDSQITDLRVFKLYDFSLKKPRIEIEVEEIGQNGGPSVV